MGAPPSDPYRKGRPLETLIPPDRRRRNTAILVVVSAIVGAVSLALGQQLWALVRSSHDEPPPPPPPPAYFLTLSQGTADLDRTARHDGPITQDGLDDQAFNVIADGPFVSLVLVSTDAMGRTTGGQQWDTVVGGASMPRGTKSTFATGRSTWQLAVDEDDVLHNAPDGSLHPLHKGRHTLRVYASSSGWFKSGRYFRLYGELPDGAVVESNVLAFEGDGPVDLPKPKPRPTGSGNPTFLN
jgi:hypothetical protein